MPIINVKLIENVFDSEQKTKLIAKLTGTIDSIDPGFRDVTFITIDDLHEGNWGIGGKSINAEMVEDHAKKNLKE